jgi:hypothetical protein
MGRGMARALSPAMLTKMYHVMQSGPSQHARSPDGIYPFSVYRSHVRGVADRHCRTRNVAARGEVTFAVVAVAWEKSPENRPEYSTSEVNR